MNYTEVDPRRLIARLAAAVMIADGRITPNECDAAMQLDDLGLGPLSQFVEEEVERAMSCPIDVAVTCAGLADANPQAAAVILTALAQVAACDRTLSPPEIEVLTTMAEHLGLSVEDAVHIMESVLRPSATTWDEEKSGETVKIRTASPSGPGQSGSSSCDPSLENAYRLLGVAPGASRALIESAYLGLVERYNPAKVIDLGPEFAALAVRRLSEVTSAFQVALAALPEEV
jgi:DnaJ-domain-containing protein 1